MRWTAWKVRLIPGKALLRRPPGDVLAGEDDRARARRTLPPMTLSRVVFPAPFGPHSPKMPRSGSCQVDVTQHDQAAVLLRHAAHLEQRRGCRCLIGAP